CATGSTTAPASCRRSCTSSRLNLAKAEFMMGLGFAIAKSTNIDQHLHVQHMLSELIEYTEFSRACRRASEADAAPLWGDDPGGNAAVDRADDVPENVRTDVRDHPAPRRRRPCRGPLLCRACRTAASDVVTYFQAAKADAATRIKLFRLAFDAAVSSFSG